MKTAIRKNRGSYTVTFTHEVQTFTLNYVGTKKECQWYKDRLDECFKRHASQQQPSRERIIKATEEAYYKWNRLENENVTYLGELIAIELSELTKGKGETHNPEGYYPKHPSEKNLGELPTEQPQSEQKRKKRKLNPDRDFTMND